MASRASRGLPDRRHNPKKPKPKDCAQCGVQFQPNTGFQKYCGAACRLEAEKIERICQHCGTIFKRARSTRGVKYCSNACSNRAAGERRKGGQGRFGLGVQTGEFPRHATCRHCNREYAQKTRGQKFCSRTCMMRFRHAENRKINPPWSIKTKGEELCRNCGQVASHLHHIVPKSKTKSGHTDVFANGLPLCRSCHYGWHHRTVEIHHSVLTDAEFAFAVRAVGGLWVERNYPDQAADALLRLDELVRGRKHPKRGESFDERVERLLEGDQVMQKPWRTNSRSLPEAA